MVAVGPTFGRKLTHNSAVGISGESFTFLIKNNGLASRTLYSSFDAVSKNLLAGAIAITLYPQAKRKRNFYC